MKGNWFLCTLTVAENNNNKKNENKQKYKFHKWHKFSIKILLKGISYVVRFCCRLTGNKSIKNSVRAFAYTAETSLCCSFCFFFVYLKEEK